MSDRHDAEPEQPRPSSSSHEQTDESTTQAEHYRAQAAGQQQLIASLNQEIERYQRRIEELENRLARPGGPPTGGPDRAGHGQLPRVWNRLGKLIPIRFKSTRGFQLSRSALLVLIHEGWGSLLRKINARLLRPDAERAEDRPSMNELPGESSSSDGEAAPRFTVKRSHVLDLNGIEMTTVQDQPVDVIVPVHNALDQLQECLDSVVRHTDLRKHRLVVIDDASTDPNVRPYLDDLQASLPQANVSFLANEEQLGFAKTCNRAMRQSDRDVVLLNSDTVVTRNWVEKLLIAAYSDERIATVVPFSNHATICSIPTFCQRNPVPVGFTIDAYGDLIERIATRAYPEIPTAVGFCMAIKRQALDEVGYFDERAFELGYGEEVDFCFKAVDAGYRHVIDDATYVYHHGGASFGDDTKVQGEADATAQIWSIYPEQMAQAQKFMHQNPLRPFHDYIATMTDIAPADEDRISLLYVSPYSFESSLGGSIFHTRDLVNHFVNRAGYRVYVMYPIHPPASVGNGFGLDRYTEEGIDRFYLCCDRHVDRVFYGTPGVDVPSGQAAQSNRPAPVEDAHIDAVFDYVLRAFDIDIVHYQHFLGGYPLSLIDVGRQRGVPQLLTVHDYFFFCYNFTLFENPHKSFCHYSTDEMRCQRCLGHHWRVDFGYQRRRRALINQYLPKLDRIVLPSRFLQDKFLELHPSVTPEQTAVIEHGIDLEPAPTRPDKRSDRISRKGSLNVAYVGFFGLEKGSRIFKDVVRALASDSRFRWHIFGEVRDPDALDAVRNAAPVEVIGRYRREDLPRLVRQYDIDIAVLLSPWPETYSYTLSEMILSDVTSLGFDVGALGERIQTYDAGFAVPLEEGAEGIAQQLTEILERPERLDAISLWKTPDTMGENARRYKSLYGRLVEADLAVTH